MRRLSIAAPWQATDGWNTACIPTVPKRIRGLFSVCVFTLAPVLMPEHKMRALVSHGFHQRIVTSLTYKLGVEIHNVHRHLVDDIRGDLVAKPPAPIICETTFLGRLA
jgi:hypothetical protein